MKKRTLTLGLLAVCVFLAQMAIAQAPAPAESETTPVQHKAASTGPITDNWKFKRGEGNANLMVNPDGTYLFSGQYNVKKPGRDFDIAFGLKTRSGAVVVFRYAGDDANGVEWSKQGRSDILKDDFKMFASSHDWAASYHLPLNSEGRAKLYREEERKREELKRKEEEARRRHAEQEAAAARREQQEELARERQEEAQRSSSGGGSSVGSVLGTIGTVVGSILAFL